MKQIEYDRSKVIKYAEKWAYDRNPRYYNFDATGGDCTNFVSQCIYEGSRVMNYTKDLGWYYINGNNKSPSWTGVEFLYRFLVNNNSVGPYGYEVKKEQLELGDIAQLSFDGVGFSHTLVIVRIESKLNLSGIRVASHTFDSFDKKITEYNFLKIRFVHIEGVRK